MFLAAALFLSSASYAAQEPVEETPIISENELFTVGELIPVGEPFEVTPEMVLERQNARTVPRPEWPEEKTYAHGEEFQFNIGAVCTLPIMMNTILSQDMIFRRGIMKHTLSLSFVTLLFMSLVLSACTTALIPTNSLPPIEEQNAWPHIATSAKYYEMPASEASAYLIFDPMSLEELEEISLHIVRGRTRDDSAEYLNYWTDGTIISGFTYTTLDILEVYKGDFRRGDTLTLAENYYLSPTGVVSTFCCAESYYPSDVGREYIFFLTPLEVPEEEAHNVPGVQTLYFPTTITKGRYPVLSSKERSAGVETLTNRQLNLGKANSTVYLELLEAVADKYMSD